MPQDQHTQSRMALVEMPNQLQLGAAEVQRQNMCQTLLRLPAPRMDATQREGTGILVFEAVEKHSDQEGGVAPYLWSEATRCFCSYPLKFFLPRDAGRPHCRWVYPVIFGGGLVSGDVMTFDVMLHPRTCVLFTSQSYTKVYMSKPNQMSRQTWNFSVAKDAFLCVLPDVLVCFKEASYSQTQVVRMEKGSNLVLLDWFLAGRIANGERWDFTRLETIVEVYHDSQLILREAQNMHNTPFLSVKESMGRFNVLGVCILIGPLISELTQSLCKKLSTRESYGITPESETIFTVSPLECQRQKIDGCIIRFASTSSAHAYSRLEEVLQALYPVLGGNPFKYKY
ncbi:uncharacterized protein LOC135370696 [Ornithodoros turicata]|uniref:uncharacterized protein LOC135370696 n=1 Tax=Ornithodoros turicata TaxID=34597 RepID=UPI003139D71D